MLVWLAVFYLGAILGSFINVVVDRSLSGKSWVKGRSRCDHCDRPIAWFDNIPLLSFLILGGKCRHCHRQIDRFHLVAEVLGGVVMIWWWVLMNALLMAHPNFKSITTATVWLGFGLLGLTVVMSDFKQMLIFDWTTRLIGLLGGGYLVFRLVTGQLGLTEVGQIIVSSLAVFVVFYVLRVLTKKKGLGGGDVGLAPFLSLYVAPHLSLVGLLLAVWSGALVGLVLIVVGRQRRFQPIPFAPFLVLGYLLSMLFGQQLWQWYWTLVW